ncbi:MAG: hypothetical protein KAR42_10465 [candidate division Zixibacteria bacterium]|nr:hypothetical protein [candidate division Zixibacteria bacterium]
MDYGKIISQGFKQAWKYKTLWIFGFLVSGVGGNFFDIGNKISDRSSGGYSFNNPSEIQYFIRDNLPIVMIVAAVVFFLILIFLVLDTISITGLIDAARKLKEKREYRFTECWKTGLQKFWPILGLRCLNFLIIFASLIVLGGITAGIVFASGLIGLLSLIIVLPLFVLIAFLADVTTAVAKRMIVIENTLVFDAIGEGFSLWKSKFGSTLLFVVIYFFLSIALMFAVLLCLLPIAIPFIGLGFINIWLALLTGIPVLILVLLVLSGFTSSSLHLMTTEFYYQLKGEATDTVASSYPDGSTAPPGLIPHGNVPPPEVYQSPPTPPAQPPIDPPPENINFTPENAETPPRIENPAPGNEEAPPLPQSESPDESPDNNTDENPPESLKP